jgi:hypothetical protein
VTDWTNELRLEYNVGLWEGDAVATSSAVPAEVAFNQIATIRASRAPLVMNEL